MELRNDKEKRGIIREKKADAEELLPGMDDDITLSAHNDEAGMERYPHLSISESCVAPGDSKSPSLRCKSSRRRDGELHSYLSKFLSRN
ncbi:unnamed protein product [Calypogeia fissa]